MFDYEILRFVCWGLLGLYLVGFVLGGGLELGVSLLWPFLRASETQRRALAGRLAPLSAGNQAWLAVCVVMLFVGWPTVYAAVFASFQQLLLSILLALLVRPCGFYFRSAIQRPELLIYWDKALFISGLLPAAQLGLLVGNLLKGVAFHLSSDMHIAFLGDFRGLFNPFSLLVSATCMMLLAWRGALYLQASGDLLAERGKDLAMPAGIGFLILFGLAGLWITHLEGYHVNTEIVPNGVSNPLTKFVKRGDGLWLDNYEHEPALWTVPILAFTSGIAAVILAKMGRGYAALLASAVAAVMVVLTMGASMFPFLAPSNISLNSSLTIWDASASAVTLNAMLWTVGFGLPVMALVSRCLFRFARGSGESEETTLP